MVIYAKRKEWKRIIFLLKKKKKKLFVSNNSCNLILTFPLNAQLIR